MGRTPLCCWWRMWLAEWVNREHISKRPFSSPASEPHCFMYWAVCHGGDGETKKRKKKQKKPETPPLSSTSWDVKLLLTTQTKQVRTKWSFSHLRSKVSQPPYSFWPLSPLDQSAGLSLNLRRYAREYKKERESRKGNNLVSSNYILSSQNSSSKP